MSELTIEEVKRGKRISVHGRICVNDLNTLTTTNKGQLWGLVMQKSKWGAVESCIEQPVKIADLPAPKEIVMSAALQAEEKFKFHPWPTKRQGQKLIRLESGSSCLWVALYFIKTM